MHKQYRRQDPPACVPRGPPVLCVCWRIQQRIQGRVVSLRSLTGHQKRPVAHRAPEENSDVALPQWQTSAQVSKSSRCHRGVSTGLRINFRHRLGRTDLSSATGYRTVSVSALWVILESLVRGLISGAIFVIVILQPCVAMHPRRTGYSHAAARWVALG